MNDDDDLLHDFDLSVWDAPAAPANLADGVIARVTAADVAIAAMKRGAKRRWWVIGGVAASVAAVALGVWIGVRAKHDEPVAGIGSGAVVAERAQRIELGASSANVDAGAHVRWTRDGSTLHVTQDAGAATWNVGPKDKLVIDAGATVAAVEAAGGSLRVEVRMNATDVRVIGASAATAAAVALVTVIVYEGHVKVTSAQQTMVVVPGTTVEVAPGKPPREVSNVGMAPIPKPPGPLPMELPAGADLVIASGESATIHDPRGSSVVLIHAGCKVKQEVLTNPAVEQNLDTETFTFATGTYHYSIKCDDQPGWTTGAIEIVRDAGTAPEQVAAIAEPVDGTAWTSPVHVAGAAMTGATVSVSGRGILVDSANHGFAGDLDLGSAATLAIRVEHPQHGIHYFLRRKGSADKTVAQKTPPQPPPACDQAALLESAENKVALGQHAAALKLYEDALRCKSDVHALQLTFMEACNAEDVAKAQVYWKKLPTALQERTLQICVRNKITRKMLDGDSFDFDACDQEALLKIAEGSVALGNHGQALKQYEDALHCKSDAHTLQLTFMEACNANNVSKAKVYWKKLSPEQQQRTVQICKRNKITRAMLDGDAAAETPATSCDPKPLLEAGQQSMGLGNHAQALKHYEDALRCKSDSQTVQLAFMASCNTSNVSKAKVYWKKLSTDAQNRALQICVRNKITRDQLDGP
jgi:tetratricopeptide (TPR) repeat protein